MSRSKEVIDSVEQIIKPVYLVGGACRDKIMRRQPNDYDFATPLSPEEIESRLREAGRRPYLVGARFGTVGFKTPVGNGFVYVEVTTFRNEKYKPGSRKPDVSFVKDITADLSRRDFTINAIALRSSQYIDPFEGVGDILNGKIRCVGKPTDRFKEDPLRMLRACRFASKFGFEIEEKTKRAMNDMAYKILEVSKERWVQEMDKLLVSDNPEIGLNYLMETRLMNFMFPELSIQYKYDQNTPWHDFDLWEHTTKVVCSTPKDINVRWAGLLHDVGKPFVRTKKRDKDQSNYIKHELVSREIVLKYARYLKWSNERTEVVANIVWSHMDPDSILCEADK